MSFAARRAALTFAVVIATAAGLGACDAVLGMNVPTLSACASGGCADGAAPPLDAGGDATTPGDASSSPDGSPSSEAGGDAATDAAFPDTGPIVGVRCGGGSSPAFGCNADPECCLDLDGGASYSCVADASACGGYPILCASYNDCAGTDVCCHFNSAIKCEPQASCANNSLVCDPAGPSDQCPSGWKCSVAFTTGSYTLPYYGCSP